MGRFRKPGSHVTFRRPGPASHAVNFAIVPFLAALFRLGTPELILILVILAVLARNGRLG